jgi:hypothetical protein
VGSRAEPAALPLAGVLDHLGDFPWSEGFESTDFNGHLLCHERLFNAKNSGDDWTVFFTRHAGE